MRVAERASDQARDDAAEPLHRRHVGHLDRALLAPERRRADDRRAAELLLELRLGRAEVVGAEELLLVALDLRAVHGDVRERRNRRLGLRVDRAQHVQRAVVRPAGIAVGVHRRGVEPRRVDRRRPEVCGARRARRVDERLHDRRVNLLEVRLRRRAPDALERRVGMTVRRLDDDVASAHRRPAERSDPLGRLFAIGGCPDARAVLVGGEVALRVDDGERDGVLAVRNVEGAGAERVVRLGDRRARAEAAGVDGRVRVGVGEGATGAYLEEGRALRGCRWCLRRGGG